MRKYILAVIVLSFSIASWGQHTRDMSHEGSAGDIYLGYSLLNGDTLSTASGIEAALTGNINDWFGLKADFSANYVSESGAGAREYNYLFGPQVATRHNKFRIFAHGLVGVAHFSGFGFNGTNGAGWALGGGVDYDLGSNFAFRPVQLDYHGAHILSATQKDVRYSIGLVYRFK